MDSAQSYLNDNLQGVLISSSCIKCEKQIAIQMQWEQLQRMRRGQHAVECTNSIGDSEFLISKICTDCFDKMFSED